MYYNNKIMKSVKKYSKKKSRVQPKVQPKVQARSNKKRVNKKVNKVTKKVKRSESRKNTKKNLQSGGLKLKSPIKLFKNWKSKRKMRKSLRALELDRRKSDQLVLYAPPLNENENENGNGNEIDVKAIFFDVDGTLSDAHCGKKYVKSHTDQWLQLIKHLKKLKANRVKLFILTRCFTYENICNGNEDEYYGIDENGIDGSGPSANSAREYYKAILDLMDGVFSADKVISINKPIPEMSSEDGWAIIKSFYMDTVFNSMSISKRTDVVLIDDSRTNAEFAANEFGFSAFHNADNTNNYVGKALDMTNNALRMLLGEEIEDSSRNFFTQVRQVQPIEDYKIRQLKQQHSKIIEHIEQIVTQFIVTGKKFSCPPITVLDKDGNEIDLNEYEFDESDFEVSKDNQSTTILGNRVSNYQPPTQNKSISEHDNFFVLYINRNGEICIKGIIAYKNYYKYENGEKIIKLTPDTLSKAIMFYSDISFLDSNGNEIILSSDTGLWDKLTPDEIRRQVIKHINENKQQFLKELYSTLQHRLGEDYRYKNDFNREFNTKPDYFQLPSLDRVLFIRPHELPKETDRQKQRREAWSKFLEERERRKSEKENNRNPW